MRVWIEHDLCTGDAQCVEICPEMFVADEDGVTCRTVTPEAEVPAALQAAVLEAAEYCPGACIIVRA
jgi:ferredoxin